MPNLKGGKKYKSSKHGNDKAEMHEINRSEGQDIARVIKALGNCNMLLLCNDGKERLGHIRSGIKKKCRIYTGDIILYSNRTEGVGALTKPGEIEKADILAKFDQEHHSKLKKEKGINASLFISTDIANGGNKESEDAYDFDEDASSADESSEDEEKTRAAAKKEAERKIATARNTKQAQVEGDDLDIDAI